MWGQSFQNVEKKPINGHISMERSHCIFTELIKLCAWVKKTWKQHAWLMLHSTCSIFLYFYLTSGFYLPTTPHLLFSLKEAFEVICIQVVFMVAVGEHQQVEIAPCWHHLIERAELLKSQSALVVISVCLLKSEMEKFGVKEHQGESNCL